MFENKIKQIKTALWERDGGAGQKRNPQLQGGGRWEQNGNHHHQLGHDYDDRLDDYYHQHHNYDHQHGHDYDDQKEEMKMKNELTSPRQRYRSVLLQIATSD